MRTKLTYENKWDKVKCEKYDWFHNINIKTWKQTDPKKLTPYFSFKNVSNKKEKLNTIITLIKISPDGYSIINSVVKIKKKRKVTNNWDTDKKQVRMIINKWKILLSRAFNMKFKKLTIIYKTQWQTLTKICKDNVKIIQNLTYKKLSNINKLICRQDYKIKNKTFIKTDYSWVFIAD